MDTENKTKPMKSQTISDTHSTETGNLLTLGVPHERLQIITSSY